MMVVRGLPDYYYPAVAGSKPEGRYVEVVPFKAERLGELADKVLTSPYGDGYSFTTSNEWVRFRTAASQLAAGSRALWRPGGGCEAVGFAVPQARPARDGAGRRVH